MVSSKNEHFSLVDLAFESKAEKGDVYNHFKPSDVGEASMAFALRD